MEYRVSNRIIVSCALVGSAWALVACGGRYRTVVEVDGAGGVGDGGRGGTMSSGKAGSGSSVAGHPSAGQGQGGTMGVAGAPAAAGAPNPGGSGAAGACSSGPVACPLIDCAPGYALALPQGACCPVCVQDPASCMKGQQGYYSERAAIVEKASYGCSKHAECTAVQINNQCEQGCSTAAAFYGSADYLTSSLEFSAEQHCAACPGGPEPPCVPPNPAFCVNGQCYLGK